MKSSSGSKGDRKDLLIAEGMTRREFLKAGVGLAAVASGLEMIAGCATTETPKVVTLVYPPLPYNKIEPPQEGCLVGFFKEPEAYATLKDSRFIPQTENRDTSHLNDKGVGGIAGDILGSFCERDRIKGTDFSYFKTCQSPFCVIS